MATERRAGRGGVVLDLRDDPGGLLDEAVGVASVFLDGGPVVSYERRGARPAYPRRVRGRRHRPPRSSCSSNPSTASAAEVVAGALQDRNRAVVVGTRTYGKGSVQEPSTLSDGSALELTVGRYLTPSGRSLDGVGIEPDVLVPPGAAPEIAERRAIDVLTGLVAALGGTGPQGVADAEGAGPQAGRAEPQGAARLPHRRRLRGGPRAHRHRGEVAARRATRTWSTASRTSATARCGSPACTSRSTPRAPGPTTSRAASASCCCTVPRSCGSSARPRRAASRWSRSPCTSRTASAKVEIALARGKEAYDKRQALAEKQSKREMQRALSRRSSGKDS